MGILIPLDLNIYNAMQSKGSKKDRPEEKLAYSIVTTHLSGIINHSEQKEVWFNDINHAKLDIEFSVRTGQKYALRIQGKSHDELMNHDKIQFFHLQEKGYIVIDFWYHKMPFLFLRNERILTDSELEQAYYEIKSKLRQFGLYLRSFDVKIISQNE